MKGNSPSKDHCCWSRCNSGWSISLVI